MEIHELNTFSGTLGSGDFFATDNGSDTSKVSADSMFGPLNARIDNIIAGGTAPSAAEVTDARLGASVLGGIQYSSLGDAVRGQATKLYDYITALKTDLVNFDNIIGIFWEPGGINGNTGADASATDRIRTGFFTVATPYVLFFDDAASGYYNIDVHKYAMDGTYAGHVYNFPVYDGSVIGYEFDPAYKYRLVSPETTHLPTIVNILSTDNNVYWGCGAINAGSFVRTGTNVATIRPFSVSEPSILRVKIPNCEVSIYTYSNGSLVGGLSYKDTNNGIAYFPLSPTYTYRLYIQSSATNHESMSCEIIKTTFPELYTGGMYNGTPIVSTGNNRTNLINVNNNHFVKISSSVSCVVSKFTNGQYSGQVTAYSSMFSPTIVDVSDCEQFYIHSNGITPYIRYELTNEGSLCGKKWCSYGDSIVAQNRWQNQLVAKFGLIHSNKGLGGSCVTGDTECPITPMTDDSRINAIDADTEIITVMGGTNDFDYCQNIGSVSDLQTSYDTATFMGSVATIVKKLQIRCPNAKIILMSNVNSRGVTGQNSDVQQVSPYGYTPYDFAIAMRDAAEWLSVDFIDTWACGINQLNRATYVSDSVHPNDAGGKLIALKAIAHFNTLDMY